MFSHPGNQLDFDKGNLFQRQIIQSVDSRAAAHQFPQWKHGLHTFLDLLEFGKLGCCFLARG